MSENSGKLQQRAELISILNKYVDETKINNKQLQNDIEIIQNFENKSLLFKTLLNEISSTDGIYSDICSIIAFETIENETFEKISLEYLQDKKSDDKKKLLIISLMKQKGLNFNYKDIIEYVDNPEELAHNGIKNFLNNALFDPEVQLDLLDFYLNIPAHEKEYFLKNLQEEFTGDDLANAFSILIQSDIKEEEFIYILDALINTYSPYALSGLEYALKYKKLTTKLKAKVKKTIKNIQNEYPNFKIDFLTKNSKIHKCYISFVDGQSNFSMIFSRKRKNDTLDVLLFTVNITRGIISCMGFCSLPESNFLTILKRLFSDSMPVEITPVALKSLYSHYKIKSDKNNIKLPYELCVWKNMLNDVREINYDISEFINSKLELIKLSALKVKKFASSKITETWHYSLGENKTIDKIIDIIEKEKCIDLDKINEIVSKTIDENFLNNKEFLVELQSKLLMQSYVASLAKLKLTSACAYSLCFKGPYTKLLITSIIDKSIYYALNSKLNELDSKNIFKKEPVTNFTKEELELIMAQLEEKWN